MASGVSTSMAELIKAMDDTPNYPCTAMFHNDTPTAWNVSIIAVGAVFFYDDGSKAQVGPVNVHLAGGGTSYPLESPDRTKCVTQVTGGVVAQQAGHPPQTFAKDNVGQPGNCMLLTHFVLGPKAAIVKSKAKPNLKDALELTERQ